MVSNTYPFLISLSFLLVQVLSLNSNYSFTGIELEQYSSFNSASTDCTFPNPKPNNLVNFRKPVKFNLKHRSHNQTLDLKTSLFESKTRDSHRIQTLHTRIIEKNTQKKSKSNTKNSFSGQLTATLGSGVSSGSGEYFMDVFIGTPAKHFSLILDTGSDLNWIQCVPCHDCFEQNGPHYNPIDSSTYKNIACNDPKCDLVSSPEPKIVCKTNRTCQYYYWYGDSSNTTGDFAMESFTVNLTKTNGESDFVEVEDVMFGCGHWNRGLFHGASGLLGLGRGPLSFSSQLQSVYGNSFSYCLVDRNSNSSVSSKLIFGEDKDIKNQNMNYTKLITQNSSIDDTYYYVQIESIVVGGEVLKIPNETWNLSNEGGGGTIVDSGTTLSYFADPAYEFIKNAFLKKVRDYPVVENAFPTLNPCYNVTGVGEIRLPEFAIVFSDGAVWDFPVENYFITLEPEEIVCLAVLGTPHSGMSIIGNYQQQNFHVVYDTKESRLGFARTSCADI